MKRTRMRWLGTAACSVSVLLLGASVSNAGLVPWVWDALFGPNCPQNRCAQPVCGVSCAPAPTYYAPSPCGPSGCGVQSAFFTPSGCSTCGSTICGVSGCETGACGPAGCPTGQCGLTPATGQRTVEPDPPPAQTYSEEGDSTPDEGWNKTEGTEDPPSAETEEGTQETEAYKNPTVVPGKDAAPTLDINEDDTTSPENETGTMGPEFFNKFDDKVTWRPAIGRTRLQRRPTYAAARLIRKPRHAPGKWMPVLTPANVAKR